MEKKENIFIRFIKWIFRTTFTTIFVIFLLIMLIVATGVIGAVGKMSEGKVKVKDNSYLTFSFPHGLKDFNNPNFQFELDLSEKSTTILDVLGSIEYAAFDPKIKGIILNLDQMPISGEHSSELTQAFENFKKSGKKIYAYANNLTLGQLYTAAAADEILMPPTTSSMVMIKGYFIEMPYIKELLDKIGVKMNVIHIGDYKSAYENLAREQMSPESRSDYRKIFDQLYSVIIDKISQARGLDKEDLAAKIFNGDLALINALDAQKLKIIDRTIFYSDFINEISSNNEFNEVSIKDYLKVYQTKLLGKNLLEKNKDKIAVLFAEGNIVMQAPPSTPFSNSSMISPASVIKEIEKIEKDPTIKAVVFRVNSGGGSALASEIILDRIERLNQKIPVVVSMGSVAASGGYYISCKARKIFASKNTITGSIGVMGMLVDYSEGAQKLGINFETVSKGKFADLFSNSKASSPERIELIRHSMALTYDEFKDRVAKGRNLSLAEVQEIAQGKIWTGDQALEIGLIDQTGSITDAILEAQKIAKVEDFNLATFPKSQSILEQLLDMKVQNMTKLVVNSLFGNKFDYLSEELEMVKELGNQQLFLLPVKFDK